MAISEALAAEVTSALAALKTNVDETCKSLADDADKMEKRAETSRKWDIFLRASTAVLAVASPALVAYSAAPGHEVYKIVAIFLTSIAGAAGTLQAVFGFRQSYVREATGALTLRQISRDLKSETEPKLSKIDLLSPGEVSKAIENANIKAYEAKVLPKRLRLAEAAESPS